MKRREFLAALPLAQLTPVPPAAVPQARPQPARCTHCNVTTVEIAGYLVAAFDDKRKPGEVTVGADKGRVVMTCSNGHLFWVRAKPQD